MSTPKVAFVDIETSPILMTAWTMFEANAIWVERDTYILCFAVRWSHSKRTTTYALPDYKRYKRDRHDDKDLCRDLFNVLDSADIVVAHNGDAFDIKKINSRLAVHGFKPPSPFKTIDTLKLARRVFKFDSNKLDNLGRYLGEGRKLPHTGADLWRGCVDGDERSWKTMRRYNAKDVNLLVSVYERLKAWAPNHPDLRLYRDRPLRAVVCPTCRSGDVQRRGFRVALKKKYERFQCQGCGAWFSGNQIKATAA
jgi:DNA polymerase elongation subunit (family B)